MTDEAGAPVKDEKGKLIYYVEIGGKKYSVYPTSERCGGDFSPAETVVSDGKLLCFSTREGIFLFNNDMRGADVGDGEGMLHPHFYSFDGHAPSYIIATAYDSVGLPVTEKTSVGESLYLKLKGPGKRSLTVTVMTDRGPASKQSLSALPHSCREYGGKERASIIGIQERAHRWIEKQIIIEGGEFASPFGICSMAFKYQPKENLKKG